MTVPLRTRTDLKRAGKLFAEEHAELLARHLLTWSPEALQDPARIDIAISRIVRSIDEVATSYLKIGIPPLWVRKFRSTALRTAGERLKDVAFAHGILAEQARTLDAMPSPSDTLN